MNTEARELTNLELDAITGGSAQSAQQATDKFLKQLDDVVHAALPACGWLVCNK